MNHEKRPTISISTDSHVHTHICTKATFRESCAKTNSEPRVAFWCRLFPLTTALYSDWKICLIRAIGTIHSTPFRVRVIARMAMPPSVWTLPAWYGVSFMPMSRQKIQYQADRTDSKAASLPSSSSEGHLKTIKNPSEESFTSARVLVVGYEV